jgi:hypothetical protein
MSNLFIMGHTLPTHMTIRIVNKKVKSIRGTKDKHMNQEMLRKPE